MPTEFLHGLCDGGHGAGRRDYRSVMVGSPMGAGGFLWALVDEGVVRTDEGGRIDVRGNLAPDGVVGPDPANTKLDVPPTDIALLHGIPPVGAKFQKPDALGPEEQKNAAFGLYRGSVWFHFGKL